MKYHSIKLLLLLLATIKTLTGYTQHVEIINKSGIKNLAESKTFDFIQPATDTNFFQFVATIKAKDKDRTSVVESLYNDIRKQANKLGANCYKVNSFTRSGSTGETVLILDCYFAWEATMITNSANQEKNTVFIFGKEKEDGNRAISIKVKDSIIVIKPGTYLKYVLKEGESLRINKGGITGDTRWIKWKKDNPPSFYTLTGFGLMDVQAYPVYGISFNSGRINQINDISLGLLLTQILRQSN